MESQNTTMKMVYSVVERSPGKSFWTRIGVGFVNKDGSLNLRLECIPLTGTLQVRDWDPNEQRESGNGRGRSMDARPRAAGAAA